MGLVRRGHERRRASVLVAGARARGRERRGRGFAWVISSRVRSVGSLDLFIRLFEFGPFRLGVEWPVRLHVRATTFNFVKYSET